MPDLELELQSIQFAESADRCALCRQQHMPRNIYRCSLCAAPFCEKQLTKLGPDRPFVHFKRGESVSHSFCGYAFATEETA